MERSEAEIMPLDKFIPPKLLQECSKQRELIGKVTKLDHETHNIQNPNYVQVFNTLQINKSQKE